MIERLMDETGRILDAGVAERRAALMLKIQKMGVTLRAGEVFRTDEAEELLAELNEYTRVVGEWAWDQAAGEIYKAGERDAVSNPFGVRSDAEAEL